MIKVECEGCGAPYQIDEKRVPATGLKMRCPKCGHTLLVAKPAPAEADLPAVPRDAPKPFLPRPAAPAPSAAPAAEEVDLPGLPATGGGFGEIDLGVDLPALGAHPSAFGAGRRTAPPVPKPTARPAASAPKGLSDLPAPVAPQGFGEIELDAPSFGEIDLPAPREDGLPALAADLPSPAGSKVDLPTAARPRIDLPAPATPRSDLPVTVAPRPPPPPGRRTVNFGDIDLPIAPAPPPPPAADPKRAAPGRRTVNFGDIDLPSLPDDLPGSSTLSEADLPFASPGAGLPVRTGGTDLPSPQQGSLPSAAHAAGLPAAAQGAGLPTAAGTGLPTAAGMGLPAAAGTGLPTAAGAGLPTAAGTGLPTAAGMGLPAAAGTGLPTAAGMGLPAAAGTGLPTFAGTGLPEALAAGLPTSASASGLPSFGDGGLPAALQAGLPSTSFGDLPASVNAFDDSDRAVPAPIDAGAALRAPVGIDLDGAAVRVPVGSEADLADPAPGPELALEAAPSNERKVEAAPPKRGKAARVGVLIGVLAAITGGALTLVPSVGPFGAYFVIDKVNAKEHEAALAKLRADIVASLDEDSFTAASQAEGRCRAAHAETPRFQPLAAYCAFVTTERDVRFGRRTEDEAIAKQLLADAADEGGDSATAANAALSLLAGQVAKARGPAVQLAQKAPNDVDYAVLRASVELADRAATKDALAAWKQAVDIHKSARTLFGLARAALAAGDPALAEANARATLAASKHHVGAKVLLATLLGADPTTETEALQMLKDVTDKGPANDAASDAEKVAALTVKGTIDLSRSRMSAAEQAFAAALKLNPIAVDALIGNGELFYRSGRFSEAQARFEAASNADPDSVVAKVGIAKTFISLERMKEAKDLLKKLREAKPTEPLVALWLGHAEEVLGNKKDAEARYAEAIKAGGAAPVAVDAYVALVKLLSSLGRTDDANAKLAEATKKFPDLPALHRARGELALQLGRYEEAKGELEAALAKSEDLGTLFRLAVALRRLRRYDEANKTFDQVAAADPEYPGLALERGVISQETGQTERALELYRKALEKAPNDIDLKLRVGQTQVLAGHPLEAEKILDEVRRARPNSAEANYYLGRVLLAKGENLAEAARYLELAAQIDGNRPEYHLYVGWVANEQGQSAKAGPALNRALELDHDLGDAYWQRGVLLQKQGATNDALADLRTALEKNPSRLEAWATIASCYQDLQKWDEAEKAWRAAIAGNHDVAEWHYRFGKLLRDHGNRAAVAPEIEAAITLAEQPNQARSGGHAWLVDAHLLLAEALRNSFADRAKCIEHYQRFLALAPPGNPYRKEAEDALRALGAPPQP